MLQRSMGKRSDPRRELPILFQVMTEGGQGSREGNPDSSLALAYDCGNLTMGQAFVAGEDEDFPLAWRQEGYCACDPVARFSSLKSQEGILGRQGLGSNHVGWNCFSAGFFLDFMKTEVPGNGVKPGRKGDQ